MWRDSCCEDYNDVDKDMCGDSCCEDYNDLDKDINKKFRVTFLYQILNAAFNMVQEALKRSSPCSWCSIKITNNW